MSLNPDIAIDDLVAYLAKSNLELSYEAELIFRLAEEVGYRYNFYLQPDFFLYSCLNNIKKLQSLITKIGPDPIAGASEVLKRIEESGDEKTNPYDQPKYLYSYSGERDDTRTLIVDLAISSAKRHARSEISDLDVLCALLDSHDYLWPPTKNSTWLDESLQVPYNTLSHIVGRYISSLWIKFEAIRSQLGLQDQFSLRKVRVELAPPAVRPSLISFLIENPDYDKNCFLIMSFQKTSLHAEIHKVLKQTLIKHGVKLLRADDKSYSDDLKTNIEAYIHGSKFAIAVYERISSDVHNPNVAFEVGYTMALGKPICLLKEKTLKTLNTDLAGNLYTEFDMQNVEETIPVQVEKWLKQKDIIN
jgi:hypothetical protein